MKRFALCLAVLCVLAPVALFAQNISVSPSSLIFEAIADSSSDAETFYIEDPDIYMDLQVSNITISGPDASHFQLGFTMPVAFGGAVPTSTPMYGPSSLDSDGDWLADWYEVSIGTNPNDPDSDGDGYSDAFENIYGGGDPLDSSVYPSVGPDTDSDIADDANESCCLNTDPNNPDSDGDGWFDGIEPELGSKPDDQYSFPPYPVPPVYVYPASSGTLTIVFRPTSSGTKYASLVLTHNSSVGTTTINLIGTAQIKPIAGVNFFCWANPGDMGGRFYTTFYNVAISNPIWDFGDGTTSTERYPAHFYTSAGSYTVKFTAIDSRNGKQYTREQQVSFPERSYTPVADIPPEVLPPPPPPQRLYTSTKTASGTKAAGVFNKRRAGKVTAGVQPASWGELKSGFESEAEE